MKRILFAIIVAVAATTLSCCTGKSDAKSDAPEGVIEFTETTVVSETPELPTVIDFNATWCGPCTRFAPIFEEAAKKYDGKIVFMSVDVDENPDFADKYNVEMIPTVIYIMPDGQVSRTVGLMEAEEFDNILKSIIE